ncbi:MAG: flagellar FlbD family protein [Firmicutes bacterium]|nr:flagellar FlbD family protein [Bacillota bacterium]HXL04563.1 flagellar FlbD family protein [Bacillota bacterium]
MIKVYRFDGSELVINADLIETIEATPDTVITLATGRKVVVSDSVETIIKKVMDYKQAIFHA